MASGEVYWWHDQTAEHSLMRGLLAGGWYYPAIYSLAISQAYKSHTSVEIGLFLATNHINLIALEDTWERDLFKKLKQWIWRPQFQRQTCYREVILKERVARVQPSATGLLERSENDFPKVTSYEVMNQPYLDLLYDLVAAVGNCVTGVLIKKTPAVSAAILIIK